MLARSHSIPWLRFRDYAELIRIVFNIGAHWCPLELDIEKRAYTEMIQMVIAIETHLSWKLRKETMLDDDAPNFQ